jgi:hypothetical protein
MSQTNSLKADPRGWVSPPVQPLDESVWNAWVTKGRAAEQRSRARYVKAVKWTGIAVMLALVALWPGLMPYDTLARFVVVGAAIVLMFNMLRQREWVLAAAFGAIVLGYNPVAPLFGFSGDWQRALVVASMGPFVASLAWRERAEAKQ